MLAPRRLPGIRVDVAPPPVAEALPRMDVAVFVGFAATGPLHVPVLVTSVPQYAGVFGADAPLAWDAQRGERVTAQLGGAVRAFFTNGGRRCWVIRVARSAAMEAVRRALQPASPPKEVARANLFSVAGVLEVSADGAVLAAQAQARSEGSWSDGVRLSTALQQRALGISALTVDPLDGRCGFRTRQSMSPGELIELRDGARRVFAEIESVAVEAVEVAAPYRLVARFRAGFEILDASVSPPLTLSGEVSVPGLNSTASSTFDPADDEFLLDFEIDARFVPRATHWLRFTTGGDVIWMQARTVTQRPVDSGSPGGGVVTRATVQVNGPAWRQLAGLPGSIAADRVFSSALEMRAESPDDDELARIGAGLTPSAVNSWWQLTNDEQFFRAALDRGVDTLAGPVEQTTRFPLAPLVGDTPVAWIPLGVDALFNEGLGPLPADATALERDGLADFDASLFLDPELSGLSTGEVMQRAESIRFLRETPRSLFGVHAALAIGSGGLSGECSLLCAPDAVHLGWRRYEAGDPPAANPEATPSPAHWSTHRGPCGPETEQFLSEPDHGEFLDCTTRALQAPLLSGPDIVVSAQPYQLQWTVSEPGAEYVLSESRQADFGNTREIYAGDLTQHMIQSQRDGIYYYRVYSQAGDERSADSNVLTVQVRQDEWLQIDPEEFAADGEPELLRLQRALLRFATAGGELFAILSLPRHYRAPEARRFAGRLQVLSALGMPGDADSFARGESRTLSFGALYHPWLISASLPSSLLGTTIPPVRVLPPDGAIAGTFAARATRRGAWVAPANERLLGVVALTPGIEPESWQSLQDAAVNIIRDDASGFLTLSADTLCAEPDLRMINVRRLLILLCRLALRRGTRYVFEPNGPALRRAVQRGFGTLLGDLFQRGAFAGRTEETSFRVITDDTVNTRLDNDAGRFIVELRIAPSLPMRFLTLLLAQSGERLTVTEEL